MPFSLDEGSVEQTYYVDNANPLSPTDIFEIAGELNQRLKQRFEDAQLLTKTELQKFTDYFSEQEFDLLGVFYFWDRLNQYREAQQTGIKPEPIRPTYPDTISTFCHALSMYAVEYDEPIEGIFNDFLITANPGDTAETLSETYHNRPGSLFPFNDKNRY